VPWEALKAASLRAKRRHRFRTQKKTKIQKAFIMKKIEFCWEDCRLLSTRSHITIGAEINQRPSSREKEGETQAGDINEYRESILKVFV